MNSSLLPDDPLHSGSIDEKWSTLHLLQKAFLFLEQKHLPEGILFLRLARERLPRDQAHLLTLIDGFLESYTSYERAQQALQEASKHFALAYTAQQTRIADFVAKLSVLMRNSGFSSVPANDDTDIQIGP